jgi:hypothetical protein
MGRARSGSVPVPEVAFVGQVQYWLQRIYSDRNIRIYNFGWKGLDSASVLKEFQRIAGRQARFDDDASRRYLLDALQVDENSWEAWANLAALSYLTATRRREQGN